jgi:hypothetical protein
VEKFELGKLMITPGAKNKIPIWEVTTALCRHQKGDYGEVSPEDKQANNEAVRQGSRILSVYTSVQGISFWIITEADRSMTTVLLPEEY